MSAETPMTPEEDQALKDELKQLFDEADAKVQAEGGEAAEGAAAGDVRHVVRADLHAVQEGLAVHDHPQGQDPRPRHLWLVVGGVC